MQSFPPSPQGKILTLQAAPVPSLYSLSSSAASLSSSSSLRSLSLSSLGGDGGSCNNGSGASSAAIVPTKRSWRGADFFALLLRLLKKAPLLAKPLLHFGTARTRLRPRDILNSPTRGLHYPKSNAARELQFPKCRHTEYDVLPFCQVTARGQLMNYSTQRATRQGWCLCSKRVYVVGHLNLAGYSRTSKRSRLAPGGASFIARGRRNWTPETSEENKLRRMANTVWPEGVLVSEKESYNMGREQRF